MTRYSERTGLPQEYQAGPFDAEHFYLQWGGVLPGNEQWSCGLRMANTGGTVLANDQTLCNTMATVVRGFHETTNAYISPRAKLTFVKFNIINTAGHYKDPTTTETIMPNVAGAGVGASTPPNQIALAISLTTAFSRGPAHRGRFYLPIPVLPVEDTGLIESGARSVIDSAATGFVNALNAVTSNLDVAVFSRKAGRAAHNVVNGVQVGRVLDTQRRRRRSLLEAY